PAGAVVDQRGCPLDADQDGVPDGLDKCPGTPAGAHVDATGCPTDADADGVPDGLDQCPNTPAGLKVDAKGCPIDSDADGVPDGVDQCPDTPAGVAVDAKGCPMDADGDGVPDGLDRCPNTPKGATVDANGCPLASDLDAVAASLVANPEIRIEVAGYTDSTGTKFSNLRLSQARAAAVRFYLARKGVAPVRMVAKGYGASGYIAPNGTAAGRAQNRRVELRSEEHTSEL